MSRSYKHTGWIQDQSSKKFGKKYANKKVRRTINIPSGCKYKRVFQSYNIADYVLPCRGRIQFISRRSGRKYPKITYNRTMDSWWWLFDGSDAIGIHKDWMK